MVSMWVTGKILFDHLWVNETKIASILQNPNLITITMNQQLGVWTRSVQFSTTYDLEVEHSVRYLASSSTTIGNCHVPSGEPLVFPPKNVNYTWVLGERESFDIYMHIKWLQQLQLGYERSTNIKTSPLKWHYLLW